MKNSKYLIQIFNTLFPHFFSIMTFAFSFFVATTAIALSPQHSYKKITSDHFHMVFDAKSYEEAKAHLQAAERAHRLIYNSFGESPSYTVLLLETDTDIANGAATGVPRPTIFTYAQPPTGLSTVNYFSNWPQDVVLHEYTHILNMEPARGVFTPLRWTFGSIVRPNMFLPRWYLEGIAVEMESRFNVTGRLKSTDYDALIRALYIDKKWGSENLSQINETMTPSWPQGQRPYFYGALLWHEIFQTYGAESVKTLNERYAGRFPYFISAPIEDLTNGKDYSQILKDVYDKYGKVAQQQIEQLSKTKPTTGKKIVIEESLIQHSPAISPNGLRLAFINVDLNGDSSIYILKRNTPQEEFSFSTGFKIPHISKSEIQKVQWSPRSDTIVFDATDTFDRDKLFFDIYSYDFQTQKISSLTKGERAREASFSPDGKSIVFTKASDGQTAIYTLDLVTKKKTQIYMPEARLRVSRPMFLNDHQITFAQKQANGKDQLVLFDISQRKILKKLSLHQHSSQPQVTSQGIVFTSYDSGVENLYFTDFNFEKTSPLTHTLTKVVNGTYDPANNMIYYCELNGSGVSLKKSQRTPTSLLPFTSHPILQDFPAIEDIDSKAAIVEEKNLHPEPTSYWPIRYMMPQLWIPFITATEDGTITSISIPGSDALGHHNYSITAAFDSRPSEWSSAFNYAWLNSLGQTGLQAFDFHTYYSSFDRTTNNRGFNLDQTFYIPGLSNDYKASLGFEYEEASFVQTTGSSTLHYFKGPSISLSYSNLEQKLNEIAPQGQILSIKYTDYLSNGTHTDYNKTLGHMAYYHKYGLPKRHRLAFKITSTHSKENRNILLGTTSSDTPYTFGPVMEGFYLRGYPPGEFIGYSMYLGKLEYKFPIADMYSGPNSPFPLFNKRLHGEIFAEALTLNGIYFEKDTDRSISANIGDYFYSAGAEGKMDVTLFYHVPATLVIGTAFGFSDKAQGDIRIYSLLQSPLFF